jgi:hypothetical protein
MTPNEAIRLTMDFCRGVTRQYVADLSDADLLRRPATGCNHVAWQLGHLISSEHSFLTQLGQKPPALPEGFAESHSKEAATSDDPGKFWKRDDYLRLMDEQRTASLAALDATPPDQLDAPGPENVRSYAPTVGAVFTLIGIHEMMHAGQFVPVRRMAGKPIVI